MLLSFWEITFFMATNLYQVVDDAVKNNKGATIFGYDVQDPERFGVIEYDKKLDKEINEKPKNLPQSSCNWFIHL